jgi:hypothetical protein
MPGEVFSALRYPDLSMGPAVRLLVTSALRSSVGPLAQGATADRDNITRLGPVHTDRRGSAPADAHRTPV